MTDLLAFATDDAPPDLLDQVHGFVVDAFEGDFADEDWTNALGGRHFVVVDGTTPLAHAAVITRTIEIAHVPFRTGYLESVATHPLRHGEGLGSIVVGEATRFVREHFEMGALGTDRFSFYERLGWERWKGPTFVRDGSRETHSEEEDGWVMVLRFGPSASVDLNHPISCETRDGDDW